MIVSLFFMFIFFGIWLKFKEMLLYIWLCVFNYNKVFKSFFFLIRWVGFKMLLFLYDMVMIFEFLKVWGSIEIWFCNFIGKLIVSFFFVNCLFGKIIIVMNIWIL